MSATRLRARSAHAGSTQKSGDARNGTAEKIRRADGVKQPDGAHSSGGAHVSKPLVLSPADAAALIGIPRTSLYNLLFSGDIRSSKLNGRRYITRKECEGFVEKLARKGFIETERERRFADEQRVLARQRRAAKKAGQA